MSRRFPAAAALFIFLSAGMYAQYMMDGHYSAMPYHGMRMMKGGGIFYVRKISSEQKGNERFRIDIHFNVPIDPRTVQPDRILLNGTSLPSGTDTIFNKAGTVLRLQFPEEYDGTAFLKSTGQSFSVSLPDAKSFNGTPLTVKQFGGMYCGKDCSFMEPDYEEHEKKDHEQEDPD